MIGRTAQASLCSYSYISCSNLKKKISQTWSKYGHNITSLKQVSLAYTMNICVPEIKIWQRVLTHTHKHIIDKGTNLHICWNIMEIISSLFDVLWKLRRWSFQAPAAVADEPGLSHVKKVLKKACLSCERERERELSIHCDKLPSLRSLATSVSAMKLLKLMVAAPLSRASASSTHPCCFL